MSQSSAIATVTIFVCSVCDKGFGTHLSCVKHVASGKYNQCRDRRAVVLPVTRTVGRHDRNVGGRQSHADSHGETHADRDSDQGSSNDRDSDLEPGAGDPESGYPTYPRDILSYPQDIHEISI
jgi:hypothetical protein